MQVVFSFPFDSHIITIGNAYKSFPKIYAVSVIFPGQREREAETDD